MFVVGFVQSSPGNPGKELLAACANMLLGGRGVEVVGGINIFLKGVHVLCQLCIAIVTIVGG